MMHSVRLDTNSKQKKIINNTITDIIFYAPNMRIRNNNTANKIVLIYDD